MRNRLTCLAVVAGYLAVAQPAPAQVPARTPGAGEVFYHISALQVELAPFGIKVLAP